MNNNFWRRYCRNKGAVFGLIVICLLYTSDAADE